MNGTMKVEASVDGKVWFEVDCDWLAGGVCEHPKHRTTTDWIPVEWEKRPADVDPLRYFEETPEMRELRERMIELMKQIAVPCFVVPAEAGDAITRAMDADYKARLARDKNALPPLVLTQEQLSALSKPRPCYRCDARTDVTGDVPLCARCRAET